VDFAINVFSFNVQENVDAGRRTENVKNYKNYLGAKRTNSSLGPFSSAKRRGPGLMPGFPLSSVQREGDRG
jgi:hypothetical protein